MTFKKFLVLLAISLCMLLVLTSCFGDEGGYECDHKFEERTDLAVVATCTEDGSRTLQCYICGEMKKEPVEALGHTEVTEEAVEATCTVDGKTEKVYCSTCDLVFTESEAIPAGHDEYLGDISAAGYSWRGYAYVKCRNCDDTVKTISLPNLTSTDYTSVENNDETKTFSINKEGHDISFAVSNFEFGQVYKQGWGNVSGIIKYHGSSTNIVLPESFSAGDYIETVEALAKDVFKGNTDIVSVTIPESLTYIEAEAFNGCTSLKTVTFAKPININYSTFLGCTSLKTISPVWEVGNDAFNGCTALESVTVWGNIGSNAFYNCSALKTVNIEWSNVMDYSLGSFAFGNCVSLEELKIPANLSYYQLGFAVLNGCTGLKSLSLPPMFGTYFGTIFTSDYQSCEEHNAQVPAGLTEVEIVCTEYAHASAPLFTNCANITDITLTGVSIISANTFEGCSALENLTISDSIEIIEKNAFAGCSAIEFTPYQNGLYFGSGNNPYFILVDLTDEAKNSSIQEFSVAEGTHAIAKGLRDSFTGDLSKLTLPASLFGVYESFSVNITDLYFNGTLEDWCNLAFDDGSNPMSRSENVYMLDGSGEYALLSDHLVIPETVDTMGFYTFQGYNFTALTLHGDMIILARMPQTLEKIYFTGTIEDFMTISYRDTYSRPSYYADEFYMLNEDDEWELLTTLVIPDSFNAAVTSNYDSIFSYIDSITTVVIPDTIRSLGYYTFYGCDNLINVFYTGTAEEWDTLKGKSNHQLKTNVNLYLYSEDEQTLDDYLESEELYWYYDDNGAPTAWVTLENTVDGKTFAYSETKITVSDIYWQVLQYAESQGILAQIIDPIMLEMYNESQNKDDFAAKITAFASKAGENLKVSFANGKMTISQNGQSASAIDYVECNGKIYVRGIGGASVFYYVDSENDTIYEYNEDAEGNMVYTTTTHTWILEE